RPIRCSVLTLYSQSCTSNSIVPHLLANGNRNTVPLRGVCIPSHKKGEQTMPGKQHVRGVGAKEQRMYEDIKESAEKEGRYKGREEEVAARTVLKHHREEGHKKGT